MARLSQKHSGADFTPDAVAACLTRWATTSARDRMIDPSCGDGAFLGQHRNSVGVEHDPVSARETDIAGCDLRAPIRSPVETKP